MEVSLHMSVMRMNFVLGTILRSCLDLIALVTCEHALAMISSGLLMGDLRFRENDPEKIDLFFLGLRNANLIPKHLYVETGPIWPDVCPQGIPP